MCSSHVLVVCGAGVLAIAIGMYLNWQCPPPSARLIEWKNKDASYFTHKRRTIFYKETRGSGSGTLLLIHGFPTFSYDWSKMWPGLTQQFERLIAPDLLGFGFSDKPKNYNYTLVEQADLLTQLLLAIRHVDKVHILAHDYGDSVAQELLARHNEGSLPFKLLSVCLTNGGMFKETNFPTPGMQLLASPVGNFLSGISNNYVLKRGLAKVFGPNTQPTEDDLADMWCAWCHSDGYQNTASLLAYIAERGRNNERWTKALQTSKVPVHVIYGPADPVNPSSIFPDYYKKTIPHGSIDLLDEKIGHYPSWEDSENTLRLYVSFDVRWNSSTHSEIFRVLKCMRGLSTQMKTRK